jgi:hypothetical protein
MKRPPNTIAPPIPTTTPIIVFRVLVDMDLESELPSLEREAAVVVV